MRKLITCLAIALPVLCFGAAPTTLKSLIVSDAMYGNGGGITNSFGPLIGMITNDRTVVVASSGGDFTSVQAALTNIAHAGIGPGVTVTVQVNDGIYASTTPIWSWGAWSKQVVILGQHSYAKTMSAVASSSGSAGAWTLTLTLNNVTSIAAGNYVVIDTPSGGVNPSYVAGCWRVNSVDAGNSQITITNSHRAASAPSGAVSATVTVLPSVLTFSGCDGATIWNGSACLNIGRLALVGDGTSTGLNVQDADRLAIWSAVGVSRFNTGVWMLYCTHAVADYPLAVSSCAGIGFNLGYGSQLSNNKYISSGNASHGFYVGAGCVAGVGNSISSGNGGNGLYLVPGGTALNLANFTVTGNSSSALTTDGFTVATLPTLPYLGQRIWASDVLTANRRGGLVTWDGNNWRNEEQVVATTSITNYLLFCYTNGLALNGAMQHAWFGGANGYGVSAVVPMMRNAYQSGTGAAAAVNYQAYGNAMEIDGATAAGGRYAWAGINRATPAAGAVYAFFNHASVGALSGTAEKFWCFVGASDTTGAYPPSGSAVGFIYDMWTNWMTAPANAGAAYTNNWICVGAKAGTILYFDSGLPVGTSTTTPDGLYVLHSSVADVYYTNNVPVWTNENTTYIPATTMNYPVCMISNTTYTATQSKLWSWYPGTYFHYSSARP